ncbi:MAG: hypothetical protein MRK01_12380 [Candidatus Scalindua sp.]|nr:hypothetical protein [Candidatus Scalindua sp.]
MKSKIPKITGLICITTIVGVVNVPHSFCSDQPGKAVFGGTAAVNDSRLDYRPVPEVSQCNESEWGVSGQKGIRTKHDNIPYRKWCEETFVNGNYIYTAYKEIAFNITYTPEQEKADFWQTPSETARIKRGDCEDAVFLFFSHIHPKQKYAEIVWGWVIDRKSMIGKAHVWYQIKDKKAQTYVVEAFSQDWNGIIPLDVLERNEIRKPIFVIAHTTIGSLVKSLRKTDNSQKKEAEKELFRETGLGREERDQPFSQEWATLFSLPDNDLFERVITMQHKSRVSNRPQRFFHKRNLSLNMKEISNIVTKLHEVLSRHINQRNEIGTQAMVAARSDDARRFCLTSNFICRR